MTSRSAAFLAAKRLIRLRPGITDEEVIAELSDRGALRVIVEEVLPEARRDLEAGDWHWHERPLDS